MAFFFIDAVKVDEASNRIAAVDGQHRSCWDPNDFHPALHDVADAVEAIARGDKVVLVEETYPGHFRPSAKFERLDFDASAPSIHVPDRNSLPLYDWIYGFRR